jgi:hypothetical protein
MRRKQDSRLAQADAVLARAGVARAGVARAGVASCIFYADHGPRGS